MPSGGGGRSVAKGTGRQEGVFNGKTEWLPLIKSKTFFSEVTGGSQCKKYGRAMQCKSKHTIFYLYQLMSNFYKNFLIAHEL